MSCSLLQPCDQDQLDQFQDLLSLVEGLVLQPSSWTFSPNRFEQSRVKWLWEGKRFQRETPHTGLSFTRMKWDAERLPPTNNLNSDPQQEILFSNAFLFCRIFTECYILFRQGTNTEKAKINHTLYTLTHTLLKMLSCVTRATPGHMILQTPLCNVLMISPQKWPVMSQRIYINMDI